MPLIDIGAESYPSFADVDFADAFLDADIQRAGAWALVEQDTTKPRALVSATRLLLRFLAVPAADPQAALVAIPETLKEVTAMLAADLAAKPELLNSASANSNIKTVRGGPASVEFFRPVVGGPPLPQAQWDMLVAAGLVGGLPDQEESGSPEATGLRDGCRPTLGRPAFDDWPWVMRDFD